MPGTTGEMTAGVMTAGVMTAGVMSASGVTTSGADLLSAVAAESNEELAVGMEADFAQMTAASGRFIVRLGEFNRRQGFCDEGATSAEAWAAERFGVSTPTARALTQVGDKAFDMPHLVGSLCAGEVSLDKVRAVAQVVTPETDRQLCDQAKECSVRRLGEVAQMGAPHRWVAPSAASEHQRRYLRFNDRLRTVSAQLPAESYAEARACIDALAKQVGADTQSADTQSTGDQTPLDQRRCDGFMALVRSGTPAGHGGSGRVANTSPYVVVLHAPLATMVDGSGQTSELAGELERDGLIDAATVRRLACDATMAVALDDDVGHTMYEGRNRRFATVAQRREVMRRDRHCRFPGCTNVTFTNVHHVVGWKPGGTTDLDNLALMCQYHHAVVHRKGWTMSGDANGELTVIAPGGRVMSSRPSPLWTRVSGRSGAAGSG
jgi:Domain of unknown function (DUF222)/HNH endonuclease